MLTKVILLTFAARCLTGRISVHCAVPSALSRGYDDDPSAPFIIAGGAGDRSWPVPAKPCPSPGVIDLVMIKVQSGAYLGEDGIVRFTDIHGRAPAAAIG